jgi:hypothetical protein
LHRAEIVGIKAKAKQLADAGVSSYDDALERMPQPACIRYPNLLGEQRRTARRSRRAVRSGFGREYDYLQQHGYTYDSATSMMIKRRLR